MIHDKKKGGGDSMEILSFGDDTIYSVMATGANCGCGCLNGKRCGCGCGCGNGSGCGCGCARTCS